MSEHDLKPKRVRGILPIVGMIFTMAATVVVAPFMGLLGVASIVCTWGAKHFGRTL
jgi:hypothetical protein